jgi:DivIVA domain-containing protein
VDISGRVLREVEFRDRLRGYDTDEVDEFLETVAVAIDDLTSEVAALRARAEQAEHESQPAAPPSDVVFPDDAALRRTLVLAQRTADLAIREAEEEASRTVNEAHERAEAIVHRAEEDAQRARDAAEFDLQARVNELSNQQDHLEREVLALRDLLTKERERLGDALSSALRFVNDTLLVSDELSDASRPAPPAAPAPAPEPAPPTPRPSLLAEDDDLDLGDTGPELDARLPRFDFAPEPDLGNSADLNLGTTEPEIPDVESEISEDAETAYGGTFRPQASAPATAPGTGPTDVDEELWERWARSSPLGGVDDLPGSEIDPFGPDRRGGRSA